MKNLLRKFLKINQVIIQKILSYKICHKMSFFFVTVLYEISFNVTFMIEK